MMKSSMNEIEHKDAVDGPVVSEGGRSPSTLSTGQGGTAQELWPKLGDGGLREAAYRGG